MPGVIKDLERMREVLITLECPGYMPLTARFGSVTDIKMQGSHGFLLLRVMKVMP